MRDTKEDHDLAEVKAVLKTIQRLDAATSFDAGSGGSTRSSAAASSLPAAQGSTSLLVFDKKRAAITGRDNAQRRARRFGALTAVGAGLAVCVAGGALFLATASRQKADVPPKAALLKTPAKGAPSAKVLTEARTLLSQGDVALARSVLLSGQPDREADLAFTLAQSYDPNYLRSLPKADSSADSIEAERWYRIWYELALKSGLDMDGERLKRIINAMH